MALDFLLVMRLRCGRRPFNIYVGGDCVNKSG